MTIADWIGSVGVFQILLAYFLNITDKISTKDLSFIILNMIGAGMACIASIIIGYWPFIILEGIWCVVSVIALVKYGIAK